MPTSVNKQKTPEVNPTAPTAIPKPPTVTPVPSGQARSSAGESIEAAQQSGPNNEQKTTSPSIPIRSTSAQAAGITRPSTTPSARAMLPSAKASPADRGTGSPVSATHTIPQKRQRGDDDEPSGTVTPAAVGGNRDSVTIQHPVLSRPRVASNVKVLSEAMCSLIDSFTDPEIEREFKSIVAQNEKVKSDIEQAKKSIAVNNSFLTFEIAPMGTGQSAKETRKAQMDDIKKELKLMDEELEELQAEEERVASEIQDILSRDP